MCAVSLAEVPGVSRVSCWVRGGERNSKARSMDNKDVRNSFGDFRKAVRAFAEKNGH